MCSGLRLLLALTIILSVICIVTSKVKHGHKKSHGPLLPGAKSKVHHGRAKARGHGPKHHHFHGPKHHHSHGPKHHHFKKTMHVVGHHFKHKHNLKLKHKHQPMLHLKAHKKGVTFAKSPAEPQACIDFLPCLQYRYYHCRSHEWIRNNCPKLCLYCEHQPFAEPMYGRFKTVAASYPDWCLDHSQCVAYPTEACAYDEWMKLNCLRKCDVCFRDKKVKAGILFVGPPFDQTDDQKKEEHQLNKILQFRPTPPPPVKDKDSKLNADRENASNNKTAPADQPAEAIKDKPNFQPPKTLTDTPAKPVLPKSPDPPVVNPPAFSPKPKAKPLIGMPAYSYQDLMKQELKAAKDAPSTKQFKADVLKQVQIKLKSGRFPQINTAHVFAKHKVTKPRRKHVVESGSAPKHKVLKPIKHVTPHQDKAVKHFKDEEKAEKKAAKLHERKLEKAKKRHYKVTKKTKAGKKNAKKIKVHHGNH